MEGPPFRLFQGLVADQGRFTLAAVPIINGSVARDDHDRLWIGCQMLFVVRAGNGSKALYGDGRHRSAAVRARAPLRDALGVTNASPLHQVAIRNHFEHFAERIERRWRESPTRNDLDP